MKLKFGTHLATTVIKLPKKFQIASYNSREEKFIFLGPSKFHFRPTRNEKYAIFEAPQHQRLTSYRAINLSHFSSMFYEFLYKISPLCSQSSLIKSEKTVVMWDVLSGDFDLSITKEKCLTNVIENYSQGSVIVFHDNIKAEEKLKYVLPSFLEHLAENGFVASNLDCLIHEYA